MVKDRGGRYEPEEIVIDGKLYKFIVTQPYLFPLNGAPVPLNQQAKLIKRYRKEDDEFLAAVLSKTGLWVYEGYRWDGPSGPTIPTEDSIQGSLFHDVIYDMMRERVLPMTKLRPRFLIRYWADRIFRKILEEDGMLGVRIKVWYKIVRKWAAYAAIPYDERT